jgi:hypothetical protein
VKNVNNGRSGGPPFNALCDSVTGLQTISNKHTSKPRSLQDLRRDTVAAVPLATMQNVCQSGVRRRQQCTVAGGGHFEHL